MKKPLQKRYALKFLTALMLLSLPTTPAPAAPSTGDVEALLPAWKESYTRGEVTHLILRLWIIAEEEMTSTALAAAREAAADEAAEKAIMETALESIEKELRDIAKENTSLSRKNKVLKNLALTIGCLSLGLWAGTALSVL